MAPWWPVDDSNGASASIYQRHCGVCQWSTGAQIPAERRRFREASTEKQKLKKAPRADKRERYTEEETAREEERWTQNRAGLLNLWWGPWKQNAAHGGGSRRNTRAPAKSRASSGQQQKQPSEWGRKHSNGKRRERNVWGKHRLQKKSRDHLSKCVHFIAFETNNLSPLT